MRAPTRHESGGTAGSQPARAWRGALNLAATGDAVLSLVAVLIRRQGRHAKGPLAGPAAGPLLVPAPVQCGWMAPLEPGPADRPDESGPAPGVSTGPPWEPAPQPPGLGW